MEIQELGISREKLVELVVNNIAERILGERSGDEDFIASDVESRLNQQIRERVDEAVQKAVENAVSLTEKTAIEEVVRKAIDSTTFQETNRWGEKSAPPKTWREMLIDRAEKYLTEPVDKNGVGKSERGHNSDSYGGNVPRVAWMIYEYIGKDLRERTAKLVEAANDQIVGGLKKPVDMKLDEIKVQLTQPR